jgi:hypothetical protein
MSYLVVSTNESIGSALKTLGHSIIRGTIDGFRDNPGYQRFKSIYDVNKFKSLLLKKIKSIKVQGKISIVELDHDPDWKYNPLATNTQYKNKTEFDRERSAKEHNASITPFKITAAVPILKGYYEYKDPYFNTSEKRPQYYIFYITFDTEKVYNISTNVCSNMVRLPRDGNALFCKNEKLVQINDPSLIQLLNNCKK